MGRVKTDQIRGRLVARNGQSLRRLHIRNRGDAPGDKILGRDAIPKGRD